MESGWKKKIETGGLTLALGTHNAYNNSSPGHGHAGPTPSVHPPSWFLLQKGYPAMSFAMRVCGCLFAAGLMTALSATDKKTEKKTKDLTAKAAVPVAPKTGIKIPGVQIPAASLKSEAEIPVEGLASIALADSVLIESKTKDSLIRIDPKTNKPLDPVAGLKKPCSGTVVAFGSLWVPNCETRTLTRMDPKTFKVSATLAIGAGDVMVGLAATPDSVWMMTDNLTTLSRIDPVQNQVVGEMRLPAGCNDMAFADAALWITCPAENKLYRVNPETNLVEKRIDVSAGPRSLAFGDNSVWILCDKDGKVDRVDPKTNKVTKSIELNVPNAGGSIAYGEGWLWVTQTGFPITRIDAQNEKVMQQFWGEGGGLIAAGSGAIWLSDTSEGKVVRFDPKRILATLAE
jgi:virginiamycin B lyase